MCQVTTATAKKMQRAGAPAKVTKLNSKLINWLIHLTVNGFSLARTKFCCQKKIQKKKKHAGCKNCWLIMATAQKRTFASIRRKTLTPIRPLHLAGKLWPLSPAAIFPLNFCHHTSISVSHCLRMSFNFAGASSLSPCHDSQDQLQQASWWLPYASSP